MNDRIRRLRSRSLDAVPSISGERAALITEFYASDIAARVSTPARRGLAFAHLMDRKAVVIGEDELIVGERGPAPKATPTYPEVTCHSLADLDVLDTRPKTSFRVDAATKRLYAKTVIPFWKGRSMRERIMAAMTPERSENCFSMPVESRTRDISSCLGSE